ncbi:ABC transporter ATP-binding protein [Tetragenococcus koreensis]|uniref:Multidrug ABC transporter ATP-binding protein n=1 Tax=Tetragenococcus koreensis TaxID=290335 RepID=A0AAN4ZTM6_9ENTE|nr:ABC transporter ATP-binding protein [Tetragenococcus koreensis]MCF1618655.1 ABC transporter ATP-binding protein [Tetragenococcus koreensis]MCF1657810.1 ABC transporter ATP-binding protein [Tetragenococcus koreensis]GEQ50323.1 multidrug ABC transporter ATP-binding protein [Tetragenococcus koreensis]GEQ52793.1 multidrug ABC transporter ATP-binding protein [Tetragenococcus koreensis]GEQ55283.1 multidrug ABC transporter ATP-binding protein [Tetragenococcus koreensis]
MSNVLELQNVSKSYGTFKLNNISFTLPEGFIMGLIGVNGAGKSTILKVMMDIVKRDQGEIFIFGKDTRKQMVEIKEDIGFVFDDSHFYSHLNCNQMKKIIAPFYKNWNEETYQSYMKRFNLPTDKKIETFSKGMKMQYNIAIALSHKAKLIIMDEPTAGLDPLVRRDLLQVLQEVVMDERASVLFSTHVTTDLEKIADYITYIHDGNVYFSAEKDIILERYAIVKGGLDLLNAENEKTFVFVEKNRHGFQGLTDNKQEIKLQFGEEVILEKANLEDIMYYTSQAKKVK